MKKLIILLSFSLLFSNVSTSQNTASKILKIKYFDTEYKPISKKKHERKARKSSILSVVGDSIHHKILTYKQREGSINNKHLLDSLLNKVSSKKIDTSKPLLIIYYPGPDPCNTSGTATRISEKKWFNKMEKGVQEIEKTTVLYVYKTKYGLSKRDAYKTWIKDPNNIVERLFFKYHYPCSSYVFISKDGKYKSYFGEFTKNNVLNTVKSVLGKK